MTNFHLNPFRCISPMCPLIVLSIQIHPGRRENEPSPKGRGRYRHFFLAVCLASLKFRELIEIILFFLKLLLSLQYFPQMSAGALSKVYLGCKHFKHLQIIHYFIDCRNFPQKCKLISNPELNSMLKKNYILH